MDLPLDCFAVIVAKLDSKDVASLLYVSKQVRQDTMDVLQPQQCLWAAGKILNKEYAEKALYAGARINKIDPATGKNVMKMIEGRSGGEELYDRLERWNALYQRFERSRFDGRAQTQEELNRHLVRCVKQVAGLEFYGDPNGEYDGIHIPYTLDEFHPYDTDDYEMYNSDDDMGIREALLDGADPNVRTQCAYGPFDPDMDLEGGLLHILTVSVIEDICDVDVTVRIIDELQSFGIDMNQVDDNRSHNGLPSLSTALHYACTAMPDDRPDGTDIEPNIRPKIVEALLKNGADPNKANSRGMTPLHELVYYDRGAGWVTEENHTLAKMLIENGADVTRCNNDGRNVLELAFDDEFDQPDLAMATIIALTLWPQDVMQVLQTHLVRLTGGTV
jgi:hypothetical protein